MASTTLVGALNAALRHCLGEDPRTLVLGEDVGRLGGVFRVTDGLQEEFGESRVFDTPLAESGIVGISVGLALAGWKPVAEVQFDGFSYPALDQIFTHLARYQTRSRGRSPMPVVVRLPAGGGIGGPEHHSESPEAHFAHVAGLKVVYPSTPRDAFNLLVKSIRDPDPVIFLEPKGRYWASEDGELSLDGPRIGAARVMRNGGDCTLVSYGAMVSRCLAVADAAAEDGVELDVVDLRSLVPFDLATVAASVHKTGRAVVVHEAPLTAGFGAEIAARVMEECFSSLRAPVLRVAGFDIPYPPASLEQWQIPSLDRVLLAVQRVLDY